MSEITYHCTEQDESKRLDFLLKSLLPDYGIRGIKRLCEQGFVLVNQKTAKAQYKIKFHDTIQIFLSNPQPEENIIVLAENPQFLTVYKKPFLHSEAHKGKESLSAEFLVKNQVNGQYVLLNRLDYATSGILLFAKENNPALIAAYKDLQENQQIEKKYLALVEGIIKEDFNIQNRIETTNCKQVKVSDDMGNRITKVRPLAVNEKENVSLLDCTIYQGARHQIRAHLSHAGFPLVGDEKYGATTDNFFAIKNLVPLQINKNRSVGFADFNHNISFSLNAYSNNEEHFCLHHYALISKMMTSYCCPPYFDFLKKTLQQAIINIMQTI